MKYSRMALIVLSSLLLAVCVAACGPDKEEPAPESPAAEEAAGPETPPVPAAERLLSEALKQFQPTAEEAALLNAAPAVNILGQTNGYFTNQDGVTGYFSGYSQPFNFIWEGGTKTVAALDGQTYQVMEGPGRLLLKFMHDDLVLQKYEGGMAEGQWHGHGNFWMRNNDGEANSQAYVGEFQRDFKDGRGVFTSYDFYMEGHSPVEYRGEFKNEQFHGQGVTTNLVTGQVIFKGWWLSDSPFYGDRREWEAADQNDELTAPDRQYSSLLRVGPVEVRGQANDPPGEGALAIIVPEEAKNVEIAEAGGRRFSAGLIRHPGRKTDEGNDLYAAGILEDIAPQDYPLTLSITFEREGRREGVSLVVKRPFILELS